MNGKLALISRLKIEEKKIEITFVILFYIIITRCQSAIVSPPRRPTIVIGRRSSVS